MRPLLAIERFFERVFERPSARIFRTRLQPVQLQRRIERAMESNRRSEGHRISVPDRYTVRLNPADLATFEPIAATLRIELAEAALEFARRHRYALTDRPSVALKAANDVATGEIDVVADFGSSLRAQDATDQTMVFEVHAPSLPSAVLREVQADGRGRVVELDGRIVTVGRSADNHLVIDDGQVSRHHARIEGRRGALVLTDLGSTNGTWVGDVRVDEVALGIGDRIHIGAATLVVERPAT